MEPEEFSQSTLQFVAHNGIAHPPADAEPNP
jgi:hypothetical protein